MKNNSLNEGSWYKPIDELTFADDFMFGRVMRDKSICKELLEILLGIKIERIEFPEIQKELVAQIASLQFVLSEFLTSKNSQILCKLLTRHPCRSLRTRMCV